MIAVVAPIGVHRPTRVDREHLSSCLESYFSKAACPTADFQNLSPRKVSRPIGLSEKAVLRKSHPSSRVELGSWMLYPFESEGRSATFCRDESRHKPSYLEAMLSTVTGQSSLSDLVAVDVGSIAHKKTALTGRAHKVLQGRLSHVTTSRTALSNTVTDSLRQRRRPNAEMTRGFDLTRSIRRRSCSPTFGSLQCKLEGTPTPNGVWLRRRLPSRSCPVFGERC